MCLLIKNVLKPCRGMKCFLFSEPAMKNTICYQAVEKAISAGFKMQTLQAHILKHFLGKGFALSKYSPVTWHYPPATAILNETAAILPHWNFVYFLIGRYMSISPWWSIYILLITVDWLIIFVDTCCNCGLISYYYLSIKVNNHNDLIIRTGN